MEIRFFFRHMTPSEALKEFTSDKLSALRKLLSPEFPPQVTFELDKGQWLVKLSAHCLDKQAIDVHAESDEIHKSVDLMMDKLTTILTRKKGKNHQKRNRTVATELHERAVEQELNEGLRAQSIDAAELVTQHS